MFFCKNKPMYLYILFFVSFLSITQAQDQTLVGCDAVHCPSDNKTSTCPVGNITLSYLGITSFNTSLASSPLTWTLGTQVTYDPSNRSLATLDRDYFLGTPPTVSNLTSTPYHGCALFFDGISANLSFPETARESGSGTCNDALSSSCVTDLLAQSQSELKTLLGSDSNSESKICSALQSALQSQPPTSCTDIENIHAYGWGNVIARELTGSNAAPFSQKSSDCNATTGENYNLSLVQSTRTASAVSNGILQKLFFGITPVLTILYDPQNSAGAESYLSCLKVVGASEGQIADVDQAAKKSESTAGKDVWGWGLGYVLSFWVVYAGF